MANKKEGLVSVLEPPPNAHIPVGEPKLRNSSEINPALMDISFTERPIQCEEKMCEKMSKMFEFKEFLGEGDQGNYKYIIDVSRTDCVKPLS
jgi:hypothetical protein